jgi:hypothetical protein
MHINEDPAAVSRLKEAHDSQRELLDTVRLQFGEKAAAGLARVAAIVDSSNRLLIALHVAANALPAGVLKTVLWQSLKDTIEPMHDRNLKSMTAYIGGVATDFDPLTEAGEAKAKAFANLAHALFKRNTDTYAQLVAEGPPPGWQP